MANEPSNKQGKRPGYIWSSVLNRYVPKGKRAALERRAKTGAAVKRFRNMLKF